jgi:hypothetical protein
MDLENWKEAFEIGKLGLDIEIDDKFITEYKVYDYLYKDDMLIVCLENQKYGIGIKLGLSLLKERKFDREDKDRIKDNYKLCLEYLYMNDLGIDIDSYSDSDSDSELVIEENIDTKNDTNDKDDIHVIIITRKYSEYNKNKLDSLLNIGVQAYLMCDQEPVETNDRILYYSNDHMEKIGWNNHMSYIDISSWDKATYHAYKNKFPYVWIIEDDVYWNNSELLKEILLLKRNDDLITTSLAKSYNNYPKWHHWSKIKKITSDKNMWISTLNCICRLSNKLLSSINNLRIEKKRLFFHEGMFPILCKMNDYKIIYFDDILKEYNLNDKLSINIRWHTPFTDKQIQKYKKSIIIHPVKDEI